MPGYAWVLEVRPGHEEEYKKRHDEIWPEMTEALRAAGHDPVVNAAGAVQREVSGIVGGSASWGQIGYWIDERFAGRGIVPASVALVPGLSTTKAVPS